MISVSLDATNHNILQASCHEKCHKISETGKLSVSYQHMRRVWYCENAIIVTKVILDKFIRKVTIFAEGNAFKNCELYC